MLDQVAIGLLDATAIDSSIARGLGDDRRIDLLISERTRAFSDSSRRERRSSTWPRRVSRSSIATPMTPTFPRREINHDPIAGQNPDHERRNCNQGFSPSGLRPDGARQIRPGQPLGIDG